jgi:hypothetical protein
MEHIADASIKEARDVLDEYVTGSKSVDEAGEVGPEPTVVSLGAAEAGAADGLAGEAAGDDDGSLELGGVCSPDIRHAKHVRPVVRKNSLGERVDVALPHAAHSRSLEPQVPAADAAEEAAEREIIHDAALERWSSDAVIASPDATSDATRRRSGP